MELVNEARSELQKGKHAVLIVSPAGSGKSVIIAEIARLTVSKGGHVLFMVHRKELVEQIIHSFQKQGVDLQHCTIMTVGKIKNRLGKLPKPNLIITDETHHSLAKTYRTIYEYYPQVARLGFTASPWRMNGKGLGEVYDSMVLGKSVKWLIAHHYLAPYRYFSINTVNADQLQKSSTGEFTNNSISDAIGKTIFGDVVENYQKLANNQQAILYAHNVEYSQRYASEFNSHGISAVHCDAKTPAKKRHEIMSDFKAGKIKILCNVDLVGEGLDAPDVPVVMLLRPTASLVVHIQQSMRGMRYKPDKTSIIIDQVGNVYRLGLPDDEHHWTLDDWKENAIRIITCQSCFATFHKWKNVDGKRVCPLCGAPAPVEDRDYDGTKKQVKAELAELSTKEGRLTLLASKSPKRQRSLWTIYLVLVAQKETNQGNVNYPLARAMHIRLDQVKEISNEELKEFAIKSHQSISGVFYSYRIAKSKHVPKEERKQAWKRKVFNF